MLLIATPPVTPTPDVSALRATFTTLADDLARSDETLAKMVADHSTVGDGWSPHLSGLAARLQGARDGFLAARPADSEVGATLGKDVLRLAEAAGSLSVMARQRTTLSDAWSSFLDSAIADARGAAELLAPPKPPDPKLPVSSLRGDMRSAAVLVDRTIQSIRSVPAGDAGSAATKDARLAAFNLDTAAQRLLEAHFTGESTEVTSQLHAADASLEDVNWQLQKQPSADGRFHGVDQAGALRDALAAISALLKLATAAG